MTDTPPAHRNEIFIVGRVTTPPVERELPSGDVVRAWRVSVERDDGSGRVDAIDCTAWTPRLQRTASSWQTGDVVEVAGAVRRRWWRGSRGLGSATDVEVRKARRLVPATTRSRRTTG